MLYTAQLVCSSTILHSDNNLFQKHQFLNIHDRKAKIQGTFQVYQIGEDRAVRWGITTGRRVKNQIKVERTMPLITFQVSCILFVSHTLLLEPYQIDRLSFSVSKDS